MAIYSEPIVWTDPFGNVIKMTEGGQMRAFADSRWRGTVTIAKDELAHEDMVRSLIERKVNEGHIFGLGVHRPFAAPYFTQLEQDTEDSTGRTWKYVVMRDYLD